MHICGIAKMHKRSHLVGVPLLALLEEGLLKHTVLRPLLQDQISSTIKRQGSKTWHGTRGAA